MSLDAETHLDDIDDDVAQAALLHLTDVLDACKRGDPSQIDEALRLATSGHQPEGMYLVAHVLARQVMEWTDLAGTDPGISESAFAGLLLTHAAPMFGGDAVHTRQNVACEFLLLHLRERHAAKRAVVAHSGKQVLHALCELIAFPFQRRRAARPAPARLEAIDLATMMRSGTRHLSVTGAACRRDPQALDAVLARSAEAIGAEWRFLTAAALALGITVNMGIDDRQGLVPPSGPQVEALLPVPATRPIMGAEEFGRRMLLARAFLCAFIGDDYAAQFDMTDTHGQALLHGLCEWQAATCGLTDGGQHGH